MVETKSEDQYSQDDDEDADDDDDLLFYISFNIISVIWRQ